MADYRAIGGVSATLRALLVDRMDIPDLVPSEPAVTIGPPPHITTKDTASAKENPQVNLFLYRVTENGYLQNQEIGRGGAGYGHPPLGLNLHYLVTAYGTVEQPLPNSTGARPDHTPAQLLLGSAMRVLHDTPVVTERVVTMRPASGDAVLDPALRGETEQIKLGLEPLSLEDITKVWTALGMPYRLSAAYVVSVVRIESRRPRVFPRPVGRPLPSGGPSDGTGTSSGDPAASPGPHVHVLAFQTPTVTDLRVRRAGETAEQPFPYARIGDTLILRGTSLAGGAGAVTTVAFGELRVPATLARADRVEVTIPDETISSMPPAPTPGAPAGAAIPDAERLQPGVRAARVIVSDPAVPGGSFVSNETAFMLVPTMRLAEPAYDAGPPRTVTLTGTRLVAPGTTAPGETVIGRVGVPRSAYRTADPTRLVVPVPDALPARGVHAFVSRPLPALLTASDKKEIGVAIDVTIDGRTQRVTGHLASPAPRDLVAERMVGWIRDAGLSAKTPDPGFAGVTGALADNRLIIIPGGLIHSITVAAVGGSPLAPELGLDGPAPPGAASALLSGPLPAALRLTSANPRLTVAVGAAAPVTVRLGEGFGGGPGAAGRSAVSPAEVAAALRAAVTGAGAGAAYTDLRVYAVGARLLIVPGVAGEVTVGTAPGDETTAAELQLRVRLAVRVRVGGAESVDPVFLELPL